MQKTILLLLLAGLTQSVWAQLCTNNARFSNVAFFSDAQINVQSNVAYGSAVNWQGVNETLRLDAYYPSLTVDTLPLRPLIMMVHGGGLVSGDKINYTQVCREFAKRGFVAVSVNYRLGLNCNTDTIAEEKAKYRAQQDIHAALRFVVQNAALLRVDTSWMFIGGGSAGSVAALGIVYLSQAEWNAFTPSLQPLLGGLTTSGNTLTNRFTLKGVFNDWGAMLKSAMQPSEMLPMVSFHGDADPTVAIDSTFGGGCVHVERSYGSRAMHNLLVANRVCSDLSVRPGGGHGVYQDSAGVNFRVGRAACFFKSLFCKNCQSYAQTDSVNANCSVRTSIKTTEQRFPYVVYPNPFSNFLQIENLTGTEDFEIFNALGQRVYAGKNVTQHDFSHLNPGIYLLHIVGPNGLAQFKIVKSAP